ncbi:MAG: hypothetical protein HFI32_08470 [Lachnospiraceae bacterium]|nr:hypothetical protein [Lachnospiraceae bacterium]
MVRSYKNGVMDGWLQHPRLNQKEELRSTSQMILLLNDLLELENCPNSPLPLVHSECDSLEQLTVFRIQILFREHYTWQGKLIWLNENQEIVFHSAIELLLLLDEILAE